MHGARGEENRPENERTMAMFEGLLSNRSVLPSVSALSPYSLLAFFFWVSPLQSSSLSLSTGFLHFLLPCFTDLICRKMKAKTEKKSLLISGFSSPFHFFFFFLFYCLPSRSHSNARMKEKNSLVLCFFSLLMPASLMFFLVFLFSFFPTLFSSPR